MASQGEAAEPYTPNVSKGWSWAPTGGYEMGDDRLKCGCFRPLDFGRPTQREAVCLTRASLLVALVFWIIILVATCQGDASGKKALTFTLAKQLLFPGEFSVNLILL